MQKQVEKEEKENIALREADKVTQRKISVSQNDIKNLHSMVSKKEEKTMKSEKYDAKTSEEYAASEEALRGALRKAQAEHDGRFKKQCQRIVNLQKDNNELKKNKRN
mmetsp:Transcript_55850/g.76232  ORF Transcript_55850/g.76232 Transcript_55850/m.76232 type:complete len:107 (-) Transcript_55850:240-560(-)